MTKTTTATMTRKQVRETFGRHRGEVVALARSLEVTHATVSAVLKGRGKSARVLAAATKRAIELQEAAHAS